ncbi:hypothetical protein KFL_001990090 [Klebsormidium nitens]|uniref:Uncharacterized protein n=1 Tax=Klebsormidium nitens TaxID=105231 RepID=A0A1Y1I7G8_KLENI|nr:hypothetical protein KFL_001990090 [Klebsormidium nitens]|eukprot:GAQ84656.1 hypothetical protein KFL_001990090 [Klebsormidium nitens]
MKIMWGHAGQPSLPKRMSAVGSFTVTIACPRLPTARPTDAAGLDVDMQPSATPPAEPIRLPENSEPPPNTGAESPAVERNPSPELSFRPRATEADGDTREPALESRRGNGTQSGSEAKEAVLPGGKRRRIVEETAKSASMGGSPGGACSGSAAEGRNASSNEPTGRALLDRIVPIIVVEIFGLRLEVYGSWDAVPLERAPLLRQQLGGPTGDPVLKFVKMRLLGKATHSVRGRRVKYDCECNLVSFGVGLGVGE